MSIILSLFLSLFSTTPSYAGGCVAGERCLTLAELLQSVATEDEANQLSHELESLGAEEIAKHCTPEVKGKEIGRIIAKRTIGNKCGEKPVENSAKVTSVCEYSSKLNCEYKGKQFWMKVAGACAGQMHDCGTFLYCAKDESLTAQDIACIKKSGKKASDVALRSDLDAVPKNFQLPRDKKDGEGQN